MNAVVIVACLLASLLVTIYRSGGSAFAFVYLPALLLLSKLPKILIPGIPDWDATTAGVYGIVLGGLVTGRRPRLRLTAVDAIFLMLLATYVISAMLNERLYMGINVFGSTAMRVVLPYFIVRVSLEQRSSQRQALIGLSAAICVVALFALIEARLSPLAYDNLLADLGLAEPQRRQAYMRFGLYRARSSFFHAIDLGVSSGLVVAILYILAMRSGWSVRNLRASIGLAAGIVASLCGLSFTSLLGLVVGLVVYRTLVALPSARHFLVAATASAIALGFAYSAQVASTPVPLRPPEHELFARSRWMREFIIKQAWPVAADAGAFGRGAYANVGAETGLDSMDNAYLEITIRRGWIALVLWLCLPLALASLVSRALRRRHSRRETRALAAGFAACMATMVAMFTVWLGFSYQTLFVISVALAVNAAQAPLSRGRRGGRRRPAPAAAPTPDGPP